MTLTLKTATHSMHTALSSDDTSSYQVWQQRVQWFSRNVIDQHSLTIKPSLWPWPCGQQSRRFTSFSIPWLYIAAPTLSASFSCSKNINGFVVVNDLNADQNFNLEGCNSNFLHNFLANMMQRFTATGCKSCNRRSEHMNRHTDTHSQKTRF